MVRRAVILIVLLSLLLWFQLPTAEAQSLILCIRPSSGDYVGMTVNYGTSGYDGSAGAYGIEGAVTQFTSGNWGRLAVVTYNIADYHGGVRGLRSVAMRYRYTPNAMSTTTALNVDSALSDAWDFRYPANSWSIRNINRTNLLATAAVSATFPDPKSASKLQIVLLAEQLDPGNSGVSAAAITLNLFIDEICFNPRGTDATPTRSIATLNNPSSTPQPTRTPIPTRTLAPSFTPAPTSTPGGATDTPVPTYTITSEATIIGMGEDFTTPTGFDGSECLDPNNPCYHPPVPIFPAFVIASLTPIQAVSTLTPPPSITMRYTPQGEGTPNETPIPLEIFSTNVAMVGTNAAGIPTILGPEGTPIDVRQSAYEAGANIGNAFGFFRGIVQGDWGRVGTLLTFLIALIALNILIRMIFFFIPIVLMILRVLLDVINIIIPG